VSVPETVQRKLQELPDAPGCYLMRDRQGRIIYVGKAVSLRKRVQSYFRRATLRHADPKLRGLVKSVADLEWIVVRNEAEALLTEGQLIKDYKPRYNVSFRDDKRFLLICADPAAPLPQFKLRRLRQNERERVFGPYASSAAARATLDFVEKRFGIRKCAPAEPDAQTYRHCINDVVRYCAAPCIGKTSRAAYRERFEEACAFLRGERPQLLQEVRERMREAAARLDFERAIALRDTLQMLQSAVRQRARVVAAPELKAEEGRAALAALRAALDLPRPPEVIEAFDISNISGTFAVGSLVCFEAGRPQRSRYRRFRIRTVGGSDDPAMIGEVIGRRFARLTREGGRQPDLILIDGGATQLRAARAALAKLNLALPSAGLAKRFEELYVAPERPPLALPADSPALKLLQRVRDEAHRFALAYHRRLRAQRLRESALDEVPGIGAVRKQKLLAQFGSVARLRRATESEIAAVGGIGRELAAAIRAALGAPAPRAARDVSLDGTAAESPEWPLPDGERKT